MKKEMSVSTYKKIGFVFAFVILDLLGLISWITGYDYMSDNHYFIILLIIAITIVTGLICIRYLNKRIEAQKTEELAEYLKDDIERITSIVLIVVIILFFIIGLVYVYW